MLGTITAKSVYTVKFWTTHTITATNMATIPSSVATNMILIEEPATDKSKRSAEGLLQVVIDEHGEYALKQNCTTLYAGEMKSRLIDGHIVHDVRWSEIVERATTNLDKSINMRFGSII